jgi:hypothetical protein
MIDTLKMLKEMDPEAVTCSKTYEYLERPSDGWMLGEESFIGIGYHGNESGDYNQEWKPAKANLGHIPSKGYG